MTSFDGYMDQCFDSYRYVHHYKKRDKRILYRLAKIPPVAH
jgi:hypothetical protein